MSPSQFDALIVAAFIQAAATCIRATVAVLTFLAERGKR